MSPPAASPSSAVADYFTHDYPNRSGLASRLFRRNEGDLAAVTRRVIRERHCRRVLDIGCGDGLMLKSALDRPLEEIILVDLAERNVAAAARNLRHCARDVTGVVGDAHDFPVRDSGADLVLLLGVLDYVGDWKNLVSRLAAAAPGCLLLNLPRSDRLWHRLRRLRLRRHGIRLSTATCGELQDALRALPGRLRVFGDRFSWYALYCAAEDRC